MKSFNERGVAVALTVCGFLSATPAGARESWTRSLGRSDGAACTASYARAVERAQEARLKDAAELFATCARATCGEVTRRECVARRAQLEADTPSIVPLVTDEAGEPRILVEVRIDGALATSRLDGRALAVDPGKHELVFSTDAGVFATRHLMAVQGERNRAIHVVLHEAAEGLRPARELAPAAKRADAKAAEAPPRAPDEEAPASTSATPAPAEVATTRASAREGRGPAPYLFAALGLAGAGGFGALTYWGRADNAMLASCAPSCTTASVRHVRELYWAADASLGVGVASLAISTWLFAAHHGETSAPGPVSLDVRAARDGGVATVAGRF